MLIDGEKWACEACVRGHRVSNCQHADRPLQHINKKGRPVSQCQHCRAMRKSRASHVKCDCGEKTHKCQHLQQTVEGHHDSCCCNHGGRCTCSHKKEPMLDTVPESESDQECLATKPKSTTVRRRRANTAHSEPVLSFDENGHHKPAHKHNKASQKCGPYSLSRGHSMHSNSSSGSMANRSVDNLLHGKSASKARNKDVATLSELESRGARSEQVSPSLGGSSTLQQLNGSLPPLDLSSIQYPEYTPSFDLFGGLSDHEPPIYSAGLSAVSVDWGQYDGLELNGDSFAPSSFDQAQSFTGFDLGSTEPTLTSNSGDVSETEDFAPAFSEAQIEGFRQSAATNYLNMSQSQGSMLTSGDVSNVDLDQFKGAAAANKFLPNLGSLDDAGVGMASLDEDPYWSMSSFADGVTESPDPVTSAFWDTQ
ncbi:Copper resistance protein CRF1 [Apiospora rasikravindrae]|uniref:Copper resistance protein CRF1 n=1 Tax=Apiospora rasikravindrae TaxID=990691 RepID=A0ABR1SK20_9PEZI